MINIANQITANRDNNSDDYYLLTQQHKDEPRLSTNYLFCHTPSECFSIMEPLTILIYCLIAAALLPYAAKIPVAFAMANIGGYDNQHPRSQQAKLEGFGARAFAAHQNAFESLLIFAIACLLAIASDGD